MDLRHRIELIYKLKDYLKHDESHWNSQKERASLINAWFIPEFIDQSVKNICENFLEENKFTEWISAYQVPSSVEKPKRVGIVMAGNIPLVGFHDMLSVFISGNISVIKLSSKDELLIKHIVEKLTEFNPEAATYFEFQEVLKDCAVFIATGSNNSSRYFEYYFSKYPHIIRKNRTSVAILDGSETAAELELLADDIQMYFGLGCRNVTKLFVPEGYDFIPVFNALKKYEYLMDYHKYRNNFDYHLALLIMNSKYYMNNDSIILTENASVFSPVSQVHYSFYEHKQNLIDSLKGNEEIQCIVGKGFVPFGEAQKPTLFQYADGVDTLEFLTNLQ